MKKARDLENWLPIMTLSKESPYYRIYRTENWGNYRTLQDFVVISGHLQDFLAESLIYSILQDYRTSGSPVPSDTPSQKLGYISRSWLQKTDI